MKDLFIEKLLKTDWLLFITGFTVMGVFFKIVNALIYLQIPEENKEILIHVLGIVEGAVMTVVGYYFGSSKEKKKDEKQNPQ